MDAERGFAKVVGFERVIVANSFRIKTLFQSCS